MQSESVLDSLLRSTISKAVEREFNTVEPQSLWDAMEDALPTNDEGVARAILHNLELMSMDLWTALEYHAPMVRNTCVWAYHDKPTTDAELDESMALLYEYRGKRCLA